MSRVGRLAGALLLETGGAYFLIGNTKGPCDFGASGFEPPVEIDATKRPFVALRRIGDVRMTGAILDVDGEGEPAAQRLARRFVIDRNGSVSERLWMLVLENAGEPGAGGAYDARWLGQVPDQVWQIVRDALLRCV